MWLFKIFVALEICRLLTHLPQMLALLQWGEMVPRRGLEPPRPKGHYDLNVARLPIPPSGHETEPRMYGLSLASSTQN